MFELNNFDSIQIGVASPEKIRQWSYGEVTKPETINYRTQKPERDGLFCERIFGPTKDYECHCGKYKRIRYAGITCDKCGVEITKSKVRRERMGHIELAAPVSHIWYFKGIPSKIAIVLDMPPKQLEPVIYFANYVVLDVGDIKLYHKEDYIEQIDDITERRTIIIRKEGVDDPINEFVFTYNPRIESQKQEAIETERLVDAVLALEYKDVITDTQYADVKHILGDDCGIKVGMGAEAIKELLMAIDLEKEVEELKNIIANNPSNQKKVKATKRLVVVEAFRQSNTRPEWMILDVIPVIPPDLRPMVQLDGGRFATSDLNDLYRRVITRNNRLRRFIELNSPDVIIRAEKRMLQEAVDALIDNGKHGKAVTGAGGRDLKSLSAFLRGKQGRFRMNLLGKRVDYSGRSVIVVGPELKIYQCGLPKEMAIELFKPFVMKELVANGTCHNIKSAKRTVERMKPCVWDILEDIIKDHPVLLNRAPTLHRLSIQAFEPVLIEGRAIKLHPLVCGAFNADFDGDQMAVHVPLSEEAQAEARFLMLSSNNILKLSDGKPVMSPTQDMVLGCYYLTIDRKKEGYYYGDNAQIEYVERDGKFYIVELKEKDKAKIEVIREEFVASNIVTRFDGVIESCTLTSVSTGKVVENVKRYYPSVYISKDEALMAYQTKQLHLQDEIKVRRTVTLPNGETITGITKTTCGRIIFNEDIPQDIGFVKREKPEDYLKFEINKLVTKGDLKKIVDACFKKKSSKCAADTLDYIKSLGYKYSTVGAITTSIFDMHVPETKQTILDKAADAVHAIEGKFERGFITDDERYKAVVDVWTKATGDVTVELEKTLDKFNPIWMMAHSGARGSIDQIKQLSGMRGLMTNPNGKIIEIPVKSCFREGLTVLEYFTSSHGGRKGLADTALKTADSGYLTRRLVDVSHSVIVKEEDCYATLGETPKGMDVSAILVDDPRTPIEERKVIESLADRLSGRFTTKDVIHPVTGEVIVAGDTMISEEKAKEIEKAGIKTVNIRSVFHCRSKIGVCAKCYGKNMSNLSPVQVGEAVGTIAAQSIGEPGTQLTMRTFHTGGIASTGDITQGLPRIVELFEARRPAGQAVLCETNGVVTIINNSKDNLRHVIVEGERGKKDYPIPFSAELKVRDGDIVEPGTILTTGSVYPQELLSTKGVKGVQDYILEQVQTVYRGQGVDINDKHVEIIVRQMLSKVLVQASGDTTFLPGEYVDEYRVREENKRVLSEGGKPAMVERILLGITKAALATESFLSAASFQETTRVLTDAAIKGKVDRLVGLKENIIIGKLIPAGTGSKEYKNLLPQTVNSTIENV